MAAALEKFEDGRDDVKVQFPGHTCMLGKTFSGKKFLAASVIQKIDEIFNREMNTYILVVLSPHAEIEESIRKQLDHKWTIIHFCVTFFSEETLQTMLLYLADQKILNTEIVLLIDDLMMQSVGDSNVNIFLLKTFAISGAVSCRK